MTSHRSCDMTAKRYAPDVIRLEVFFLVESKITHVVPIAAVNDVVANCSRRFIITLFFQGIRIDDVISHRSLLLQNPHAIP